MTEDTLPPSMVRLAELTHTPTVIFVYPGSDTAGQALPIGWDQIPGLPGCTAQAGGFRDLHSEFQGLGFGLWG